MEDITAAVKQLYNTYPFPPDPLSDQPPPGYNWRWCWQTAYHFCTGQTPENQKVRILDAGCGTGSSTEYLITLNPHAEVLGIDLSEGAIRVAKERCSRSGVSTVGTPVPEFRRLSLYSVDQLPGQFDFINCVGVLHHLPDPIRGLQTLALKLAPGGLMHIFVYAELGRWEIRLMQEAIRLLRGTMPDSDYTDGVKIGRQLFASLPEDNRLVKYESSRWALENQRDECFADMYVHPQEIDYNVGTLFDLIEASGLEFIGFSNPGYWQLERLIGKAPDLMRRTEELSDLQRYRLVELLDPQISHYEFFLARPPLTFVHWSEDDDLLNAMPQRSPCLSGWPSQNLFDYDYQLVNLSEVEFAFMEACEVNSQGQASSQDSKPWIGRTVEDILKQVKFDLDGVRSLHARQLILLSQQR